MATEAALGKQIEGNIETPKQGFPKKALSAESLAEHEATMARVLEEGEKRIHRSVERLVAMGFYDKDGNRLQKALPPDMLPGADRDFGG